MAMRAAVKALEGEAPPTLEDFKAARDLAKSAFETLKASYDLLSKGINQVMEDEVEAPPASPSAPLFTEEGHPRPEADLSIPALLCKPYPEEGALDVEIVGDPATQFCSLLDEWEKAGFEEGRSLKTFIQMRDLWWEEFQKDITPEKQETLGLLKWAMENVSGCWCDPKCALDLQMPSPGEEVANG
jgi:hypothetical protein